MMTPLQAEQGARFGSPEAVDNRLAQDQEPDPVPLKQRLSDQGVNLALDYSMVAMGANTSLPGKDNNALSGMLRFYGSWALTGAQSGNTGSLVWKLEHRHSFTDVPVKFFEFDVGALGLVTPPFSDEKTRLTNLYWKQSLRQGKATVVAGFLDATDYFDVYALASPWSGFLNFAFSTGSTTVALPGDATLGIAGATMLGDNWFVIAGVTDMNSDPTEPWKGFDTLFSDGKLFKSIELGWTTDQSQIYVNNLHLSYWHADESEQQGTFEGQGINLSASFQFGPWLPFLRAGFSEDTGALTETSISGGVAYFGLGGEANSLGLGVNWAEIDVGSNQYTTELYYLMRLTPYFELTPDLQYIRNPALDPSRSHAWLFGLRGRLFF
ncbi:carbohydrate porin [Ferrimonas marina]|nr:carbohydrate porin [Ferrimonas marina]